MLNEYKLKLIAQILRMEKDTATEEKIVDHLNKLKPYSRGVAIIEILTRGIFASERILSEELKLPNMGMETFLAVLPECILNAFKNRDSIKVQWAYKLDTAHNRNPQIVNEICQKIGAGRAAGERWPAAKVFKTINCGNKKDLKVKGSL